MMDSQFKVHFGESDRDYQDPRDPGRLRLPCGTSVPIRAKTPLRFAKSLDIITCRRCLKHLCHYYPNIMENR